MNLSETQRWFAKFIMRPLTSGDQMIVAGNKGRELAEIDSIIAPNAKLSAFERLEIYNRQYWFRFFDALRTDFPALKKLTGEKRFRNLAQAYLTDCPSTSYTLRDLGSRLPDWLAANPLHAGAYPGAAVDIARLEWAYVEAFDAAELRPINVQEISPIGEYAKLRLQPHLRLVELCYAIDEFTARAHDYEFVPREKKYRRTGLDRFRPLPHSFAVAVYRHEDHVVQRPLEPEACVLLKLIAKGKPLGEALETVFLNSTIAPERIAERIEQWFSEWHRLHWFTPAA